MTQGESQQGNIQKYLFASLFILLLVLSACSSGSGSAASGSSVQGSKMSEFLHDFFTLKFLGPAEVDKFRLGIISQPIEPIEGFTRFLLLILLFALLFKGAELLKLGKNIAIVLALTISLMTVIFIPSTIILAAAVSYSTFFSLLILGVPVALCFGGFFMFKESPWLRFLVMVLLVVVLWQMQDYLQSTSFTGGLTTSYQSVVKTVAGWITWVIGTAVIFAVISLFSAIGGAGGSTDHHPNWLKNWVRNKVATNLPGTEAGAKLRHERREQTRLLNDLAAERRELELLRDVTAKVQAYKNRQVNIAITATPPAFQSQPHLKAFELAGNTMLAAIKAVDDAQHKWKRAQRKETQEMRKLLKELIQKGVATNIHNDLEQRERRVLGAYAEVDRRVRRIVNTGKEIRTVHERFVALGNGFYSRIGRPAPTPAGARISTTTPYRLGAAQNMMTRLNNLLAEMLSNLQEARVREEGAANETMRISEIIKTNWKI